MLDGLGPRELVEGVVGKRQRPCAEADQDGHGVAPLQPGEHGAGTLDSHQAVVKGYELGADRAAAVAEKLAQALGQERSGCTARR